MLRYSVLRLTGNKAAIPTGDRDFEATTGPLGQGAATSIGMAFARQRVPPRGERNNWGYSVSLVGESKCNLA